MAPVVGAGQGGAWGGLHAAVTKFCDMTGFKPNHPGASVQISLLAKHCVLLISTYFPSLHPASDTPGRRWPQCVADSKGEVSF